jgi:hypothetical protein
MFTELFHKSYLQKRFKHLEWTELVKIDFTVLGFGILCLLGGLLLAYFGLFAPPYFLIPSGYYQDSWMVLALPFFLLVLGLAGIWGGLRPKATPKETKIEQALESLPPPPPPPDFINKCSNCGQQLIFIKQYSRWYCYNCKKYA